MSELRLAEQDLGVLVEEWIDWATAASLLGVTVGKVRTMIREHELAAAVPPGMKGQHIPALFIQDGLPVKG
ncbi:MAG: transcriptional regulator, partial [Actinomycetota bacterium]|nr:transcriptional regulator [Actinomycetota bacterium]